MKEINPYLKEVEKFLIDLPILDRNKIISELNSEISENTQIMDQPASITADQKRLQAGFDAFQAKNSKGTFGKVIFKTFGFMFACFLIFIGFLMWKFTPLLKIDEENQRVTILGGLIDLDGEAGKFIIGNEVHFTASKYTNDLTGVIQVSKTPSSTNQIMLNFSSGKFELQTNTNTNELEFDCKLSSPPSEGMITDTPSSIVLDFTDLDGSNCKLNIPENFKVIANGEAAAFEIKQPHFDIELELEAGNILLLPDNARSYFFDLQVNAGIVSDFTSSDRNLAEHRIKINLNAGNISQ